MDALFLPEYGAYLRYHDLPGQVPARIYLHCLGGAAALYLRAALQPDLAGKRAVLVDLLGFGLSDRPEAFGYALADHAAAVAALLDRLALGHCDVIGHSMGGHVAVALAAERPDLVGRLALAEAPLAFGSGSASRAIAAQTEAEFRGAGFEAFAEEIRAEAAGGDAGMAAFLGAWRVAAPHAVYRSAVGQLRDAPGLRDRLLRLPVPRAYLWGARTLREPDQARLAEELVRHGVEVGVVPDAGHHMHLDNPAGFAAALVGALNPGRVV